MFYGDFGPTANRLSSGGPYKVRHRQYLLIHPVLITLKPHRVRLDICEHSREW